MATYLIQATPERDTFEYTIEKSSTPFGDYWLCEAILFVGPVFRAKATSRHKQQALAYCLRDIADQVELTGETNV